MKIRSTEPSHAVRDLKPIVI